ncbi:hypothetical protein JY651_18005 [Pyxidicoccus parkwayensis]|uniref:Uncharacterized protein n=1 Tax=Pyxidicoccus parkwayensis TaxID=2813578 RepID=A0ABX7P8C4_9BACT|nr:hypothetical protein [Pyxidicoccus parkwaysis]QSQ26705.1 hypothetical protein JY651_18005 [Pyxidicoccus parkwaysis]
MKLKLSLNRILFLFALGVGMPAAQADITGSVVRPPARVDVDSCQFECLMQQNWCTYDSGLDEENCAIIYEACLQSCNVPPL